MSCLLGLLWLSLNGRCAHHLTTSLPSHWFAVHGRGDGEQKIRPIQFILKMHRIVEQPFYRTNFDSYNDCYNPKSQHCMYRGRGWRKDPTRTSQPTNPRGSPTNLHSTENQRPRKYQTQDYQIRRANASCTKAVAKPRLAQYAPPGYSPIPWQTSQPLLPYATLPGADSDVGVCRGYSPGMCKFEMVG